MAEHTPGEICDHPQCITSRAFHMALKQRLMTDAELGALVKKYAAEATIPEVMAWPELMRAFASIMEEASAMAIMEELIYRMKNPPPPNPTMKA